MNFKRLNLKLLPTSIILTFILISYCRVFAQTPPAIAWQKSLGGTHTDGAESIIQTKDGGYLVAGLSVSNDGDVTGNQGSFDMWIAKLDQLGILTWQKSYGGSRSEVVNKIIQTFDGGYILAGFTDSQNDGDVTNYHGGPWVSGGYPRDFWIVKIDSVGNIQWQSCYGGTKDEEAESIIQTPDSGYVVIGYAESNDGDVLNHIGSEDMWVLKLDKNGALEWQNCFGGTSADYGFDLDQTNDGGFVLAGGKYGASNYNYLMIKIDSLGSFQWQQLLGGSEQDIAYEIHETNDRGYILAGLTYSNDGDVSGNHSILPYSDYWIVKTDSIGSIVWQRCLGGSDGDRAQSIVQTNDGGYVVAGWGGSNDGDITSSIGSYDFWVIKLDSNGLIAWEKSLGGSDDDRAQSIVQTNDGGFIIAGGSFSNDVDVSGNQGLRDMWIVKLLPDVVIPTTSFYSTNTIFCTDSCIEFTNQSIRDSSWQWFFPGGNPSTSNLKNPPPICYSNNGTYDVTLITGNSFGSDTLTLSGYITIKPAPNVQASATATACVGDTISLTANGAQNYSWSGPNGFSSINQSPVIPSAAIANGGSYTVIGIDSTGCSDTAVVSVSVVPNVQAQASSNSPICEGSTLNFNATNGNTFNWTGPNGFTSSSANPILTNANTTASGNYSVTVTNACGTTSLGIQVIVNPSPTVNITGTGSICEGDTISLLATGGNTYSWSGPSNFIGNQSNITIYNSSSGNSGNYTAIGYNSFNCTDTAVYGVLVTPDLPLTTSSNSPICEGETLLLTASNGTTYQWIGPNGFASSTSSPSIPNATINYSGTFSVTSTNACGLKNSQFTVLVNQSPEATIFTKDITLCSGDTLLLEGGGIGNYVWTGPSISSQSSSQLLIINVSQSNSGIYTLLVENTNGCSDTASVQIAVDAEACFFIPSVFTPNEDGYNDSWEILGISNFPKCIVKVFNRWGQNLFQSNGYTKAWDGQFDGNPCPIADYYYIIDLGNGKTLTGTVTIKR